MSENGCTAPCVAEGKTMGVRSHSISVIEKAHMGHRTAASHKVMWQSMWVRVHTHSHTHAHTRFDVITHTHTHSLTHTCTHTHRRGKVRMSGDECHIKRSAEHACHCPLHIKPRSWHTLSLSGRSKMQAGTLHWRQNALGPHKNAPGPSVQPHDKSRGHNGTKARGG